MESENFEKMSNNEHNETNLNKKTPRNRKTDTKHSPISIDQISNTIDTPVQSHHNCIYILKKLFFLILFLKNTAKLNARECTFLAQS